MSPRLTIGLPVRNGAETLEAAIDTLLAQTFRDFVLVISDNESDDATAEICERAAARDPRVRYIRQARNIGNPGNFRFTLMQAQTPYFMWAAHDDFWAPTFAERNIALLDADPSAVAAVSKVALFFPAGPDRVSQDTSPILDDTPRERVRRYFEEVSDSSRYYSVFRTDVLKRSYPEDVQVFGFDWIILALTLVEGRHLETPEVLLRRTDQAFGHYFRTLLKLEKNPIDRMIPYRQLSLKLKSHLPPEVWRDIRLLILRYNLAQCASLLRYRVPALTPLVRAAGRARKAMSGKR
jgi:glycosyltransferase involved in cell wall biosynthesis